MDASDSRTAHRPSPIASTSRNAPCTSSTSAGSTWPSHPTSMANPHTTSSSFTSSSIRPSATPTPSPTIARPGAPRTSVTSPPATEFDEAEWARRAEERAMQQRKQFKRELERQAKGITMQTQELTQLKPTRINGGGSRTATTLGGTASRVRFSTLKADEARRSEKEARREEEGAGREDKETRDEEEEARRKEVREARAEVQAFEERLQATEEDLRNCLETVRQGFDVFHRKEDALRRK
ncbi:hypothetical protein BJV78DRAFT_1197360 [Lactifluus subvellereus]|nr:hypothetical protein BJV78DRAFT_1197360 [Lactifluus subvellereus]